MNESRCVISRLRLRGRSKQNSYFQSLQCRTYYIPSLKNESGAMRAVSSLCNDGVRIGRRLLAYRRNIHVRPYVLRSRPQTLKGGFHVAIPLNEVRLSNRSTTRWWPKAAKTWQRKQRPLHLPYALPRNTLSAKLRLNGFRRE